MAAPDPQGTSMWRPRQGWSVEARLLGIYLRSGGNRIGCFHFSYEEAERQTELTKAQQVEIIAQFVRDGFARFDAVNGWIWVPDVLLHNPFGDTDAVRAALPELAAVPRDTGFYAELIQCFRASADRPGISSSLETHSIRGLFGRDFAHASAARLMRAQDRLRRTLPGLPSFKLEHLQGASEWVDNLYDYSIRCQSFLIDLLNTPTLRTLYLATIVGAIAFVVFPGLDLGVARWFFDPPHNFSLGASWIGRFFDGEIHFAMEWFLVLLIAVFLYGRFRKRPVWGLTPKRFLFIALSIALSAGLITNVVFKDSWGRARPSQIVEFGGTKQFSPPFMRSSQCDKNCSFVSGDASLAASFLTFAVVAQRNRRRWWAGLGLFTAIVGLMRMARGSHFLSDVAFAVLFTLMVVFVMARLVLEDRWRAWPRWRNPAKYS